MWDQEVKLKDDTPDHLIKGLALSVILLFCIFCPSSTAYDLTLMQNVTEEYVQQLLVDRPTSWDERLNVSAIRQVLQLSSRYVASAICMSYPMQSNINSQSSLCTVCTENTPISLDSRINLLFMTSVDLYKDDD